MGSPVKPVAGPYARSMNADEPAGPCIEILLAPSCKQVADVPFLQLPPLVPPKRSLRALIVAPLQLRGGFISLRAGVF